MKIRIQGNSLRYRLREPEVAEFKRAGRVSEAIQLGPGADDQLRFVLQASADNSTITVLCSGKTTTICVPLPVAHKWTDTDLVGFDAAIEAGAGKPLKILVEKDFKCLNGPEEENEGAYPNPMKHC